MGRIYAGDEKRIYYENKKRRKMYHQQLLKKSDIKRLFFMFLEAFQGKYFECFIGGKRSPLGEVANELDCDIRESILFR